MSRRCSWRARSGQTVCAAPVSCRRVVRVETNGALGVQARSRALLSEGDDAAELTPGRARISLTSERARRSTIAFVERHLIASFLAVGCCPAPRAPANVLLDINGYRATLSRAVRLRHRTAVRALHVADPHAIAAGRHTRRKGG